MHYDNDGLLLYLIRHGGTAGNAEKRYIGKTDESVTDEWKMILKRMHAPEVGIVCSSPMRRCVQTARILYGKPPDVIAYGLHECDFGRFEGKNYIELSSEPDYQRWIDSGGKTGFPDGEDVYGFEKRIERSFMDEVVAHCRLQGVRSAAVVTHGGVIMGLLEKLGDGSVSFYDHMPANGECIACIYTEKERPLLIKRRIE